MNYQRSLLKIKLELIGMAPLVWLGKLYGRLRPLKKPVSHFLFYSSADLGGAIKVNADIIGCLRDQHPMVIFSKRPKNNGFIPLFEEQKIPILDLHRQIDNKLFHFVNFFWRGVLATWINRSGSPVVFGGETLFFYKVIPHIRKDIPRVELCHLDTWLPYSLGLVDRITTRICSTHKLIAIIRDQYAREKVPPSFADRLVFIENKIDIPEYQEVRNDRLEVIYVGRGAPQKRVHLIAAIAAGVHQLNLPVHFSFVGDVDKIIDPASFPFCTFYGNVSDEKKMHELYRNSDVLILTSAYEGLPLVVMQMMAYGKIVLSTAVNGIPDYIGHMVNGLLIYATDEPDIVNEGIERLRTLIDNPDWKFTLGKKSREVAAEKFGGELFCREFRRQLVLKN